MITHVYSDPHFGHANIIKYEQRPFDDVRQHDAALIELYNSVVHPEDTVLWLGDCFLMPYELAYKNVMMRLNGHKILIPGNHDRSIRAMLMVGFAMVIPEATIMVGDCKCRCHHYPYRSKLDEHNGKQAHGRPVRNAKGDILLHGHTHGKLKRHDDMVHVGVDAWGFRPVSLRELTEHVR
jgi:calcineurin-like phosphoesterase family protein